MYHGMRKINEKGIGLILFNELHGPFSILGGELFLVSAGDLGVNDTIAINEWEVCPFF